MYMSFWAYIWVWRKLVDAHVSLIPLLFVYICMIGYVGVSSVSLCMIRAMCEKKNTLG